MYQINSSIQDIKKEIDGLPQVGDILKQFNSQLHQKLQHNSDEHKAFMKTLNQDSQIEVMKHLVQLKQIQASIKAADIGEKLNILAHYVSRLKVTTLTKDHKQTNKIMSKFLKKNNLSINSMIGSLSEFQTHVEKLKHHNRHIHHHVSSLHKDLEDKASIHCSESATKKLAQLHTQHKKTLKTVGSEFANVTKILLKDKEYKKFLKQK